MIFQILILCVTKIFVTADIQLLPTKAEDLQSLVESVKKDVDWHLQIWAERGRLADLEVPSDKKPIFSSPTLTKNYTVMNATTSTLDHLQEIAEYSSDGVEYYYGSVKGRPGKDFPDYTDIPLTSFTCSDKTNGFHADLDTGCQVFHVCWPERRESFLCPLGTIFNQELSTCDHWYNTNCSRRSFHYKASSNAESESKVVPISSEVQKTDSLGGRDPATSIMFFVSEFMPIKAKIVVYPKSTKQRSKVPDFPSTQTNMESNPKSIKRTLVSKHSRVPRSLGYQSSSTDSLEQLKNKMYLYHAWEALKDAAKEVQNDKSTAHLSPYTERILKFIKYWFMMDELPEMVKVEPGTELYESDLRVQKTVKDVQFLLKMFVRFVADLLHEMDVREKEDEKSNPEVLKDDGELQDLNVEPLTNLNPRFIVKPTSAELELESLREILIDTNEKEYEKFNPEVLQDDGELQHLNVEPLTNLNPRFIVKPTAAELELESLQDILNPLETGTKRSTSLNLESQQVDPMRIHPGTKEALLKSYVKLYRGKRT